MVSWAKNVRLLSMSSQTPAKLYLKKAIEVRLVLPLVPSIGSAHQIRSSRQRDAQKSQGVKEVVEVGRVVHLLHVLLLGSER